MKKTLDIDDKLLKEAKVACGAATDTEAVHLVLKPSCARPLTSSFALFAAASPMRKIFLAVAYEASRYAFPAPRVSFQKLGQFPDNRLIFTRMTKKDTDHQCTRLADYLGADTSSINASINTYARYARTP